MLPQHNSLIRFSYFIGIAAFFIFVTWTAVSAMDFPVATASQIENNEKSKFLVDKKQQQIQLVNRKQFTLVGLGRNLDLTADVEAQLTQLWSDFADKNLAQQLELSTSPGVIVSYRNYQPKTASVYVVIGYSIRKNTLLSDELQLVDISAGEYIRLPGEYVLSAWQDARRFPMTLNYDADYELFQVDENFNIKSQTAFISFTKKKGI